MVMGSRFIQALKLDISSRFIITACSCARDGTFLNANDSFNLLERFMQPLVILVQNAVTLVIVELQ